VKKGYKNNSYLLMNVRQERFSAGAFSQAISQKSNERNNREVSLWQD